MSVRRRVGPLILVGLIAGGLYATGVEPYWIEVTRHSVPAPLSEPLRVAQLADLHTHGFGRRERAVVALLERERPDLIVLTGDQVVDGEWGAPPRGMADDPSYERLAEVLPHLQAPLGVWAVRGNWEIWRPLAEERAYYARFGVTLLVNEAREVRPGFWLAGLDDALAGAPDADRAGRDIPEDALVLGLFHSPAAFDRVAGRWPFALAGHTHGGQARLPFLPPLWLPPGSQGYADGWYERSGSRLYVSRGVGTSVVPIRTFCRPEVALFTLGGS